VLKNNSGVIETSASLSINAKTGLNNFTTPLVDSGGGFSLNNINTNLNATENSPSTAVNVVNNQVNIDTDSDGFDFGTSGTAVNVVNNSISHIGESDTGSINFISQYANIGNNTDSITIEGLGYMFGFANINDNVTIDGWIQGYGFQPTVADGATFASGAYVNSFYDAANIATAVNSYTSYNASPIIDSVNNNSSYAGLNIYPTIDTFSGNAGFNGVSIGGNLGTFDTGFFNGLNINPTVDMINYANGIYVSMDNVTVNAGSVATLVIQDLTISTVNPGSFGNSVTFEFTSGGTAGSEVVSGSAPTFQVQIESGVSTATQVKAALDAYGPLISTITTAITGTASNAQVTQAATNMSGGVDPGNKKAAYLDGDVEITGALTFGGALSIGTLNAFKSQAAINGGGTPTSIHSLVSNVTVANSTTIANADTLGINTACLIDIGSNSTVTTSFTGISALALPAVANIGAGASVDRVAGATFALSLGTGGVGGVIDTLDLCRAITIPNGVTSVTKLTGYKMDLPFGSPGVTSWGFYESPGVNNYFAGNLLIGGTAGSDDTVTNSSVALEIKSTTKAFMNARMTTAQRDALTAVDGMQIYNSSVDKLQVYAAGSWVDLH
jgi:hypothetical protein